MKESDVICHGQPAFNVKVNDPVPPWPGILIELLERTMLQVVSEEKSIFATKALLLAAASLEVSWSAEAVVGKVKLLVRPEM
jgi:hypothetical protein